MGPRLLRSLIAVLVVGCVPPRDPVVPAPKPVPLDVPCAQAQARLTELKCPEQQTPEGASFESACKTAALDGRNWRPECIAKVATCDEVEAAFATPPGEPCPE